MPPNEITYIYDDLGRLTGVVDPAGDAATYIYDSVGNLLAISRQSASLVSIVEFTPKHAPVGASVTISGTGFSTVASQNSVLFNGTAASVLSASATQIVVHVPPGTTTGPLTITTPVGTATSRTPFTVDPSTEAPTITAFTPTIGAPDTALTITGTNFAPTPASNKVLLNNTYALVSTATNTSLATSVPNGTGSGRISVITPFGKAVSSGDFFIPPTPHAAADVEFTGRMAIGESQAVTIDTAGKIALVLFEGTKGQRIRLDINGVSLGTPTGPGITVSLLNPDGTVLTSKSSLALASSSGFLDPKTLPTTGTYTIVVDSQATTISSMNLALRAALPDVTTTITIGGPLVPVSLTEPGQNAQLNFAGTTGQQMSLGISAVTLGGPRIGIEVTFLNPLGTAVADPKLVAVPGDSLNVQLPMDGMYTIVVDPTDATTASLTLTLSEPVTDTLIFGGPSIPLTLSRPGQNARLTFAGAAGQQVNLGVSAVSLGSPNLGVVTATILNPDGTTAVTSKSFGPPSESLNAQLSVNGTYTVVVDPRAAPTASLTLTLSEPVSDTLVIGGPSVPLTLSRPGQNARLTFTGAAGQRVSLRVSAVSFGTGTASAVAVSILNPDGTQLASSFFGTSGGILNTQSFPASGTYTVLIVPSNANTASLTLTLSQLTS
jgi:YD repeat-containing protein